MIPDPAIAALRPYNFRGKLRLLDRFVPRTGERKASVFGYEQPLDLSEAIQRWVYMGTFEPQETSLVRRWLQPGMTFLDVGANVGYFTLLAASRVGPRGAVHAIEPSPYAFNRLEGTVRANSIGQVALHNLGLSAENGEMTLYVQPRSAGFHSPSMSPDSGGDAVAVQVRRLDDALREWGVESVDLMKLDVEGHELQVIRGGADSLGSGRVRAILCEFNEHWLTSQGTSGQELYAAFQELGFVDGQRKDAHIPGTFETRSMIHRSAMPVGRR